jgi:hypothetical protein
MTEKDLTLVGLTEDKQKLVLVSAAGDEFTLPADARLRAALRGETARLGQLEISMESALRPRDIQARIRGGESPEDVATAAQTTIDKIMGYATPVLAERAHVAERAQRASIRRKGSDGPSRLLGDAVGERLRGRNVDPATVEWDAWRREDGRWTLVADYRSGESPRHAEFVFDAPGRYVVAEDDEARWLVGETTTSRGPQPRSGVSAAGRRLSAVSHPDAGDEELPLGEDAIGMVSEVTLDAPAPTADEPTEDVTAAAAAVRGEDDWIATQATERPQRPRAVEPEQPAPAVAVEEPEDAEDTEEAPAAVADEAPRRTSRKNRRASVPSWDEIMFGGGKRD